MSERDRRILGSSPAILKTIDLIKRVSATKTNVLIIGESGTGKELVARMIHDWGPMKGKPFIPVNCGAIPENLIESEMFGHKKGSFTGAVSDKPGLFEAANTGTLFLDEVGELPLSMQVKLLRALQERTIRRVGGNDDMKVDVRIIAATNRDLEAGIAKGTFREDLYYRLNVIQVKSPALRDRGSDIRMLAEEFLNRFCVKQGKSLDGFDPEALKAIEAYAWPGNVRELENVMERAVTLETGPRVSLSVFPPSVTALSAATRAANEAATSPAGSSVNELRLAAPDFSKGPLPLDTILGEVEKKFLLAALDASAGVKTKAAELLGLTFRSFRYRLKKLGLSSGDDDEGDV